MSNKRLNISFHRLGSCNLKIELTEHSLSEAQVPE